VEVRAFGEWWAVWGGDGPVRTPMGTPVVSRHRGLAEEVAADVERWGTDPTAKTTTFSLQASYLDFGLRVKREVLEENTAAIWPNDLFVQRPADPALDQPLRALWGAVPFDRDAFRELLRGCTLRQLMAAMTAGAILRSAVLGWTAITTDLPLAPLARGGCGRWFDARPAGLPGGAHRVGGGSVRHVPTDMDEAFCRRCCAGEAADEGFPAGCALHPLLDKLRRWSRYPEERP
jgi:hypothetical protein